MIRTTYEAWETAYKSKLILPEQIVDQVQRLKAQGLKIATLNGSFDLMHAGHLYIIHEASQVADVLIVALNSDASIKKYKSPERPIIPLEYRLQMMAALGFVDYVTWFEETDPRHILSLIRPDVHVNGAEYGADCLEAEVVRANGGQLHIVPRIPGLATSQVIQTIRHLKDV